MIVREAASPGIEDNQRQGKTGRLKDETFRKPPVMSKRTIRIRDEGGRRRETGDVGAGRDFVSSITVLRRGVFLVATLLPPDLQVRGHHTLTR